MPSAACTSETCTSCTLIRGSQAIEGFPYTGGQRPEGGSINRSKHLVVQVAAKIRAHHPFTERSSENGPDGVADLLLAAGADQGVGLRVDLKGEFQAAA